MSLNLDRLLGHAREIQQIPAPTFSEQSRAAYLEREFRRAGLCEVTVDEIGNVFGRTRGQPEPCIVVSAHLDTVFPKTTHLNLRQEGDLLIGPGIGDNAVALACLVEMANILVETNRLAGCVWFVANVREEGLGNLEGMHKVVDRFGSDVDAYIVLEGLGLGHIYHRALEVQRYRLSVETKGGHAWIHSGRDSAIHVLIQIGARIVNIPRPKDSRTSVNIGTIEGGTSINTIASEATLDLDLRAETSDDIRKLEQEVNAITDYYRTSDVVIRKDRIGFRPGGGISADHLLVQLACEALDAGEVKECLLGIASTDANVPLSTGYPAVCIGLTKGGHAHTTEEYVDTKSLPNGFKALHHLIHAALRLRQIGA